ncbi:MAG TPA: hypothetical protein VGH43_11905 [Jatrophihabitans sp.]
MRHDPNLSNLARAIALDTFEQDRLPVTLDAARLAAEHGVTERDVWLSVDELQDDNGPRYLRLFQDGAAFLNFDRWQVRDLARQLARNNRTTIGRVLQDAAQRTA